MKPGFIAAIILLSAYGANAQQLLLLDRFNGNRIVNDSTLSVFSSDVNIYDLTQYFTMKNNTDQTLRVNLRKTFNIMNDSASDYFCFRVKCWPEEDTTDIPAVIQPGAEDYTFASHVTHIRRFDMPQPVLPPGLSSITYTVFDNNSFPEPLEASVTVIYHLNGLGVEEEPGRPGEEGKGRNYPKIYPNPASERVTVETSVEKKDVYTLALYNSHGTLVHSQNDFRQADRFEIDVAGLAPGIYFGRLVSGNHEVISFRFQVAR
jgi:hypothetical protein